MRLSQLPSRKKKPENCEKCSLIKFAESCLVRKRRNSVCIIYSSSMPLGKNSNGIPIKSFSLVFAGLVIIWDRGGAGRPFLVWLTSCLRYGDPLFWSLWPLTSRVTFSRAASLPALLIRGLVLPSVCLCFCVCVCNIYFACVLSLRNFLSRSRFAINGSYLQLQLTVTDSSSLCTWHI